MLGGLCKTDGWWWNYEVSCCPLVVLFRAGSESLGCVCLFPLPTTLRKWNKTVATAYFEKHSARTMKVTLANFSETLLIVFHYTVLPFQSLSAVSVPSVFFFHVHVFFFLHFYSSSCPHVVPEAPELLSECPARYSLTCLVHIPLSIPCIKYFESL